MALKFLNDGYFAGKVGIGIVTPTTDLHIKSGSNANLLIEGNQSTRFASLQLKNASQIWVPRLEGTSQNFVIRDDTASSEPFRIKPAASTGSNDSAIIIDGNANVGIGVTNPSDKLSVAGNLSTFHSGYTTKALRVTMNSNDVLLSLYSRTNQSSQQVLLRTNGNSYFNGGNVGIGTTSPDAKLEIKTDGEANSFIKLNSTYGTGNIYGLKTNGGNSDVLAIMDITAGNRLAAIGQSEISFATGGTTRLLINSSGNVGIGTTSPGQKLQVSGGNVIINGGSSNNLYLSVTSNYLYGDVNGVVMAGAGNNFRIKTDGSERVRVIANGNVGIGTTNPSAKLDVIGVGRILMPNDPSTGAVTAKILSYSTAPYGMVFRSYSSGTNSIQVQRENNNSQTFALSLQPNDGNVGIGTTTPLVKLHVETTDSSTARFAYNGSNYQDLNWEGSNIVGGSHVFKIGGAEKMRITSGGNVGIGSTNPATKFVVQHTDGGSGIEFSMGANLNYIQSYNRATSDYIALKFDAEDIRFGTNNGSERMRIDSNGNVGIGTTNPGTKLQISGANSSTSATALFSIQKNEEGYGLFSGILGSGTSWLQSSTKTESTYYSLALQPNGGNVGIGTTNPLELLHLESTEPLIRLDDTNSGVHYIFGQDGDGFKFTTNNSTYGKYTFDANVGIGTTSPGAKLEISHSGSNDGLLLENTLNSSNYQIALNIRENEGLIFQRWVAGAFNGNLMRIGYTGGIKFDAYDGTNNTGTPTYLLGTDASGNIVKTNTVPGSGAGPYLPLAGGTMTGTNGILMPDDFKLKFGDATTPDLEIYHDGSNSNIVDTGTGYLSLRGTDLRLQDSSGWNFVICTDLGQGGEVALLHKNVEVFTTTDTGVTVAGNIIVGDSHFIGDDSFDNLVIQAGGTGNLENLVLSASNDLIFYTGGTTPSALGTERLRIYNSDGRAQFSGNVNLGTAKTLNFSGTSFQILHDGSNGLINNNTGDIKIQNSATDKDIIFKVKDGASNVEAMRIDGSANRVGIGVTNPSAKLHVAGDVTATGNYTAGNSKIIYKAQRSGGAVAGDWSYDDATTDMSLGTSTSHSFSLKTGNTRALTINSSQNATFTGNVSLIATSAKNYRVTDGTQNIYVGSSGNTRFGLTAGASIIQSTGASFGIGTQDGNSFILGANNNAVLTLDNSKNATFAGDVTMLQTSGNNALTIDSSGGGAPVIYLKDPTRTWGQFVASGDLYFKNETTNVNTLILSGSNATFAGGITVVGNDAQFNHNIILEGGIFHKDDTNTSFGFPADDNIAFTTSGSERMRIDSSGNANFTGKVGIGTTTAPTYDIDIHNNNGRIRILGGTGYVSLDLQNNGQSFYLSRNGATADSFATGNTAYAGILAVQGNYNLEFATNGFVRQTISGAGNVGIGTASPHFRLDLSNSAALTPVYQHFTNGTTGTASGDGVVMGIDADGDFLINNQEAKEIKLYTNDQQRLTIQSGGNVGIGTTAPSAKLNVVGTGTQLGTSGYYYNTLLKDATNSGVLLGGNNTDNGAGFLAGINELAFLTFGTSWGERMRITGAGNVGIGTGSPSQKLHVHSTSGDALVRVSGDNILNSGGEIKGFNNGFAFNVAPSGGGAYVERMRINGSGNVGIGTSSPSFQLSIENHATTTSTATMELDGKRTDGTDGPVGEMIFSNNGDTFATVAGFRDVADNKGSLQFQTQDSTFATRMTISSEGNVGIGTTSPTQLLHVNSTTSNPTGIGLQNSQRYYSVRSNNYSLVFTDETVGTERMRINSSGNVGIGVTNPEKKLHVKTTTSDSTPQVLVQNDGTGDASMLLSVSGQSYVFGIDYDDSKKFKIASSSNLGTTDRVTLLSTGQVGIGTITPSYQLEVASTGDGLLSLKGATKPVMRFMVGTSTVGTIQAQENTSLNVSAYGTSSLNLQTAGTVPRLTILTGGNVGIGTTSPVQPLQVNGTVLFRTTTADGSKNRFQLIPGGSSDAANLYLYYGNTGDGSLGVRINAQGNSYFNGGNVGIGVTGPSSLLEIEGATNSSTSNLLRLSRATQGSTPEKVAGFYSGTSGEKGYITVNNFGTAYNTSSDYRLKENIKPIDNSVERLMSLKPCNFNFISKDEDKVVMDGFIAHEAKEVVPEAVTGIKDAVDEKGNPAYQGIDQSKLVPLLTAALQEALQRIEILEQKINN